MISVSTLSLPQTTNTFNSQNLNLCKPNSIFVLSKSYQKLESKFTSAPRTQQKSSTEIEPLKRDGEVAKSKNKYLPQRVTITTQGTPTKEVSNICPQLNEDEIPATAKVIWTNDHAWLSHPAHCKCRIVQVSEEFKYLEVGLERTNWTSMSNVG